MPATKDNRQASPVEEIDTGPEHVGVEKGVGLCLSGGGYRAMLFHLGALWRLNQVGYLPKLDRVSSVSGGSITAGVLGLKWGKLDFRNGVGQGFEAEVAGPIRRLASTTVDVWGILAGLLLPGSVADRAAGAYRKHLFGKATLQDLPDHPWFVINATNVQSEVLWRFMKPYMRDYRVGEVKNPRVPLAMAVAASAAFPPFLSPARIRLTPSDFTPGSGDDLQKEPFTRTVVLTDGGVYDNLGLETVWKRYDTVLVSDGGGKAGAEGTPKEDWPRHAFRAINLIQNQVLSLRKRTLIASFINRERKGAYWGITTDISHYGLDRTLPCPVEKTCRLAAVATRLKRLDARLQERLINWGYASCDAGMRRHVDPGLSAPSDFPYPDSGVG